MYTCNMLVNVQAGAEAEAAAAAALDTERLHRERGEKQAKAQARAQAQCGAAMVRAEEAERALQASEQSLRGLEAAVAELRVELAEAKAARREAEAGAAEDRAEAQRVQAVVGAEAGERVREAEAALAQAAAGRGAATQVLEFAALEAAAERGAAAVREAAAEAEVARGVTESVLLRRELAHAERVATEATQRSELVTRTIAAPASHERDAAWAQELQAQRESLEAHAAAQQAELRAELRRKQQVVVELGGALGAVQAHVSELGHRVRTSASLSTQPQQPLSAQQVQQQCSTPSQPPPSQLPSPTQPQRRKPGHERFVGVSPLKALAQPPFIAPKKSGTTHPGRKESQDDVARRIEETNRRLQASLSSMSPGNRAPKSTPITLDRAGAFGSAPRLLP